MEVHMKIDGVKVRVLREEKSWSQEHLASASGLSSRTIQRIESEGVGSPESRLALAAALGVPASALARELPKRRTRAIEHLGAVAAMITRRPLACSFCGKDAAQTSKLVAGPRVYICDVCAAEVTRIMNTSPPAPQMQPPRSWWSNMTERLSKLFERLQLRAA
jgi:transcriptional regulator with XRE-family HTH domain